MSSGIVQWLSTMRAGEPTFFNDDPNNGPGAPLQFHDALYFIIVTFSTVGFGDVTPLQPEGRVFTMLVIILFFFLVPMQTAKVFEISTQISKYTGAFTPSGRRHIVVCCDPTCRGLEKFLHEFLHPDHGVANIQVVLLVPAEPTAAMSELIVRYAKERQMTYLKGDLLSTDDLMRANVDSASGCFILTDQHAADSHSCDAMTILRTISVLSLIHI